MKILIFIVLILAGIAEVLAKDGLLPSSFKATFEQRLKSEISGKEKVSVGEFIYEYPTKLRFEIKSPDQVILTVNPEKAWYYTAPFIKGEPGEATVRNSLKTPMVKFFDELHKGGKSDRYTMKNEKDKVVLTFTDLGKKETGVMRAEILYMGTPKFENIFELLIVHDDQKQVKLIFKEREANPKLDQKIFTFEIPSKTNIREQ